MEKSKSYNRCIYKFKYSIYCNWVNNLFQTPEGAAAKAIFHFLDNTIDSDVLLHHWISLSKKVDPSKVKEAIRKLEKRKPYAGMYYEAFILQDIYWEFLDIAGIREDIFSESGNGVAGYKNEEVVFYNLGMFSQIINDFETIYFNYSPQIKLKTFLNFLQYSADDYYPEGWLNNSYKTPNAVQIMTIYQAKGLEFPVVFIPGLNKNYLPTSQPTGTQVWHFIDKNLIRDYERYFPLTEDERRLMYVAITRSKKFLIMSRSPDGRQQCKESVFGEEIRRSDYLFSSKDRDYSEREKTIPKSNNDLSNITLNFSLLKDFFRLSVQI
ncbi:MAG: ATP-dependent helicase [Ignavibacteria bacterium]|nr:ATP-dependent helicase [Ignavibacteria bacterium]